MKSNGGNRTVEPFDIAIMRRRTDKINGAYRNIIRAFLICGTRNM